MKYTAWLIRDPHKKKEAYDLEINWRIDEYREKKHGKNDTTLEVFKVTFREKLPDSQFRPWKEDIESSQKGSKRGKYNF